MKHSVAVTRYFQVGYDLRNGHPSIQRDKPATVVIDGNIVITSETVDVVFEDGTYTLRLGDGAIVTDIERITITTEEL